jgi:hypothetical protein
MPQGKFSVGNHVFKHAANNTWISEAYFIIQIKNNDHYEVYRTHLFSDSSSKPVKEGTATKVKEYLMGINDRYVTRGSRM